jgi:hypothetical protein
MNFRAQRQKLTNTYDAPKVEGMLLMAVFDDRAYRPKAAGNVK